MVDRAFLDSNVLFCAVGDDEKAYTANCPSADRHAMVFDERAPHYDVASQPRAWATSPAMPSRSACIESYLRSSCNLYSSSTLMQRP